MADVASTLAAWSSTTASNAPSGATTIGSGLDDNLRELQGVIVRGLSHKGSDIASVAGTTDIGAVEGLMHDITGANAITGLGTVRAGILKVLKFEGAATLTHNATSLILPGGANIVCADGDAGIFISEGSGNWRCLAFLSSATAPIAATQTEQEAASTLTRFVTPARQSFHPSAIKGWVKCDVSGNITVSHNVSSITDTGTGLVTVTWNTDFSGASYVAGGTAQRDVAGELTVYNTTAPTAGATVFAAHSSGSLSDPVFYHLWAMGDQ